MKFPRISFARIKPLPAAVAALTALAIGLVGSVALLSPGGSAIAAIPDDALAGLENRSPGQRLGGIALKGKSRGAGAASAAAGPGGVPEEPRQRALGKIFDEPLAGGPGFGPVLTEGPIQAFGMPGLYGAPAYAVLGDDVPGVWIPAGGYGPGTYLPPGGGGYGGGGNPGGGTPIDTTPAPAVPEPQTWGLLLMGFAFVGASARYRLRAVRPALHP